MPTRLPTLLPLLAIFILSCGETQARDRDEEWNPDKDPKYTEINGIPEAIYLRWEKLVLAEHNRIRAEVATEPTEPYPRKEKQALWPGGARPEPLPELTWSPSLAAQAREWAARCPTFDWQDNPDPDPHPRLGARNHQQLLPTQPLTFPSELGAFVSRRAGVFPQNQEGKVVRYFSTFTTDEDFLDHAKESIRQRQELPSDHPLHAGNLTKEQIAEEVRAFREYHQQLMNQTAEELTEIPLPTRMHEDCHRSGRSYAPTCNQWRQVVRRATKKVGCAIAICAEETSYGDTLYNAPLACLYDPKGDPEAAPYAG